MKANEFLEKLDGMLEEKIPKYLAKIGVPAGYTKCKTCGKMYHKEFGICPYCVPGITDEDKKEEEEDASGGLIDDVVDDR